MVGKTTPSWLRSNFALNETYTVYPRVKLTRVEKSFLLNLQRLSVIIKKFACQEGKDYRSQIVEHNINKL